MDDSYAEQDRRLRFYPWALVVGQTIAGAVLMLLTLVTLFGWGPTPDLAEDEYVNFNGDVVHLDDVAERVPCPRP